MTSTFNIKILFLTVLLFSLSISSMAQIAYAISGVLTNSKSVPLESASVFIDGSKKITITNSKGEFLIQGVGNGTHQLVAKMIGYEVLTTEVTISGSSMTVNKTMQEKEYALAEVTILGASQKERFLTLFKKYFLGESVNAKSCEIINPDILNFNYSKDILTVDADEFLIVKNNNLGYVVKYLLSEFKYNKNREITSYTGECIFEEMSGSKEQQQVWAKQRAAVYKGSMMHYLRSLHTNSARAEGFLTYKILNTYLPIEIQIFPVASKKIVEVVDSNFFKISYPLRLYVTYDLQKAKRNYTFKTKERVVSNLSEFGSIFKSDGLIDAQGNLSNYKKLLIQGFWGTRRIGDQLPNDYMLTELIRK